METNLSPFDRILRLVLAVGIIVLLFFVHSIGPIIGVLLVVKAGVLVVTSIAGFCPAYGLLNSNTAK